jgi:multiple antibiotic resistance protein
MAFTELAVLLFLVSDPFGNLPLVLATLQKLPPREYKQAVIRETTVAFVILAVFAWLGDTIIARFGIAQASLHVAGGILLFLISLRMIFEGASEIFVQDRYQDDPWLVPIAIPAIAGPGALTTVIVLKTQSHVPLMAVLGALAVVFVLSLIIFAFGRRVADRLKPTGMRAIERFMGLLLALLSVNMTLYGIKLYFT